MATPQEINETVIKRMNVLCRPRWDPEREPRRYLEMVEQYAATLEGYTVKALVAGMDEWAQSWTDKFWALPAQLVPYMNQARERLTPRLPPPAVTTNEPVEDLPPHVRRNLAKFRKLEPGERERMIAEIKDAEPPKRQPLQPRHVPMPAKLWQRMGVEPPERET